MSDPTLLLAPSSFSSLTTILIVDDSKEDRFTYRRYLQLNLGLNPHQIFEAETLEEGLSCWRSQRPDLALIDLLLPDGHGLDFLAAIKTNQPTLKLPVIVMTGQGDEWTAVQSMKLGASDYLIKEDITASALCRNVSNTLNQFSLTRQLEKLRLQESLVSQIALYIHQFFQLEEIYQAIVHEVRSLLAADRVAVYKFDQDMGGAIVAESVVPPWDTCLNAQVIDTCFQDNGGEDYQLGRIFAVEDIYTANLTPCHRQLLERFQVRANLVVPIILPKHVEEQRSLWGLLIVHQCSGPRYWDDSERYLMQRLSIQLAIALQQAELYENLQVLNASLEEKVAERTIELQTLLDQYREAEQALKELNQELEARVERRTAALQQSERRLRETQQFARLGSWELDALSGKVTWSPELYEIFKLNPENSELTYQDLSQYFHPSDRALREELFQRAINQGEGFEADFQIIRSDGSSGYLLSKGKPSVNETGQVTRVFGFALDITERKQAEAQLQETNAKLARATRLKDEFLANMSHELRTPLNSILGMAEGLQDGVFGDINPRQWGAINLIERSGKHLLELINDILDLAKIEAGKLELQCEFVSIHQLCESSTLFVQHMAFSKQIQLRTQIAEQLEQVWVDERRMRQVLINLLSNAVKFTPAGGQVTLDVRLEQTEILFSVTDTGIGVNPQDLEKLFQPFVQIDSRLNRQYSGTGLGLTLVQRITAQHGGNVSVKSQVGQGSCFTVRLPYVCPDISEEVSSGTQLPVTTVLSAPTDWKASPLILLVDDNEGNMKSMEDYLSQKGYRLLLADNGKKAVELATQHQPDLIFMDIQMPEMDGLEATARIRSHEPLAETPIVILTALKFTEYRDRYLATGANEYLNKPIRFKQLIETIHKFCGRGEVSR